jgi:hypothetical protein
MELNCFSGDGFTTALFPAPTHEMDANREKRLTSEKRKEAYGDAVETPPNSPF